MRQLTSENHTHEWPPTGDKGNDTIAFDVPAGEVYHHAQLTILGSRNGGGARVDSEPGGGATGGQSVSVHWYYDLGGKISYQIDIFVEAAVPPDVALPVQRRPDIRSFSSGERQRLADLIMAFLDDAKVHEHMKLCKNELFTAHRDYIRTLEDWLLDHNGDEFVPLPFWDPAVPIPGTPPLLADPHIGASGTELWAVKQLDGHPPMPGPNRLYNTGPYPRPARPAVFAPANLASFADAHALQAAYGDAIGTNYHVEFHLKVGGVMGFPPHLAMFAPCAAVFWLSHAWLADTYWDWCLAKLRGCTSLAAATNHDGRIELFAIGRNGKVFHTWQKIGPAADLVFDVDQPSLDRWLPAPSYVGWEYWTDLDGVAKQLVATSNQDGRLEVFVIGSDDALWHRYQLQPGGAWSGWESLGGQLLQIAVAMNDDGRLEVFAVDRDRHLVHLWQVAPDAGWSPWATLDAGRTLSSIAVGKHRGKLEVFGIDTGGHLASLAQTAPSAAPWSGWASLDDQRRFARVTPAQHADGHLQVFAIDDHAAVLSKWRRPIGGDYTPDWHDHGHRSRCLAAALDTDGRMELFSVGTDGLLRHSAEVIASASASWNSWLRISDGRVAKELVTATAQGDLIVFGTIVDDLVWATRRTAAGWSRWRQI